MAVSGISLRDTCTVGSGDTVKMFVRISNESIDSISLSRYKKKSLAKKSKGQMCIITIHQLQ